VHMPFQDKNEFEASDPEDESLTGAFPEESPDDEEELSEEELAAEMEPLTVADWKQEIPDYTAEEFEEKIPDRTRSSWMAPVVSCLFGTLLGAVIAGALVDDLPRPRQLSMFFVYLVIFALPLSLAWHWLFIVRSQRVAKKMKGQQANPMDPQTNLAGSEPIHPK
jgi:hypothetical protein